MYAKQEGKKLSREEDLELEKQLKLVNKPAVKTIKTIQGDVYNCVDFYQQPAFDHPLLKNHTFDFKISPSSYPMRKNYESGNDSTIFDPCKIWLNGKGCPVGTVPIRKVTKKDLLRANLASQMYGSKFNPQSVETPGLHFAVLRTKPDPNKKYHGAQMQATIHGVKVNHAQSSYGRMKVKNSADYIEVGWMVNPLVYNEELTRMYIYTNAGQSRCFNTFCPGFVIVSTTFPIDAVLPVRTPKVKGAFLKFMIDRDVKTGNWYLYIGDSNIVVGYWNYRIFEAGLNNFATYIDWGGQVYGPPNLPSAPMGAGVEVSGRESTDAYCWKIQYANGTNFVNADNVEGFSGNPAYNQWDVGVVNSELGHQFFYGGAGGYIGN
ncbi:unnamed protein product [Dovyalis caffra]|uniref:Neprosin PEP catalytic domain-containing protein n=1 Tax=Dovyalis caffra TaxID=77055 RepID=A0AAV1R8Q7_9ROSI|nr:unnamed protein product [Dovyalis caffra]